MTKLPDISISSDILQFFIQKSTGRHECANCNRNMKLFCYYCGQFVHEIARDIARVQLPFDLLIISHKYERRGKNTAIHAKLLTSSPCHLIEFNPNEEPECSIRAISQYLDKDRYVLLWPPASNKEDVILSASTIANMETEEYHSKRYQLIVLDGTWSQINAIYQTLCQSLGTNQPKKVCLSGEYQTQFWRSQNGKTDQHLATIEAIYWFAKEYSQQVPIYTDKLELPVKSKTSAQVPLEQLLTLFKLQQHLIIDKSPRSLPATLNAYP